jgi:hypothetical protein
MKQIKSKGEARDLAIRWQRWQSRKALSMSQLIQSQAVFRELGARFGLLREFQENGIL